MGKAHSLHSRSLVHLFGMDGIRGDAKEVADSPSGRMNALMNRGKRKSLVG